jgi:hypothetical protein
MKKEVSKIVLHAMSKQAFYLVFYTIKTEQGTEQRKKLPVV